MRALTGGGEATWRHSLVGIGPMKPEHWIVKEKHVGAEALAAGG